jgi:hypothetical protein
MKELFLSHSNKDALLAKNVKCELEKCGWTAFLSSEDIEPSQDWQRTIEENLKECLALIVIATYNINESPWVNQEIGFALGQGKPVFSLIFEGSDNLPAFLKSLQGIDAARDQLGQAVKKVVDSLTHREDVVLDRADVRSIMARRPTTDFARYFTMSKLEVYASLHELCDGIMRGAPRPGQMLALIHEGRVHDLSSEDQRRNLWLAGVGLPAIRVSDAQLKEFDEIVKTRRYLLEESTANAWHQVLRKAVYGFSLVQHDLELHSFGTFVEDVTKQFDLLRKRILE